MMPWEANFKRHFGSHCKEKGIPNGFQGLCMQVCLCQLPSQSGIPVEGGKSWRMGSSRKTK